MAKSFSNKNGAVIVERMVAIIHENRAYLSEIDGAIGDGDHGINMNKGFQMASKVIAAESETGDAPGMSEALRILGKTLVMEIGGSMGPLYGSMFREMARETKNAEQIDAGYLLTMLEAAYASIQELGDAKPGDKTMVDTLYPALEALRSATSDGADLSGAARAMINAAEIGWKSTKDMVAKIGRAARLGERSRGNLDAGATSCYLLLKTIGETMIDLADGGEK